MISKTFEVRDRGTFIGVLAVKLEPACEADRYLLARTGYGKEPQDQTKYILLVNLVGGECSATTAPYKWGNRTLQNAHLHIEKNFGSMASGDVVDVEFILGLTTTPKVSERLADSAGV